MPNTNPAVLFRSVAGWNKLSFDSIRPKFLLEINKVSNIQQEDVLRAIGNNRLMTSSQFKKLDDNSRIMIIVLACIAKRKRDILIISEMVPLSIDKVQEICNECEKIGWIDNNLILTKKGRNVLRSIKNHLTIPSSNISLKTDFYFPKQLRSPN
jgi:hypothetical protein